MDFFNIISQRKDKVIYRDGDKVVKVFDENYSKSNILNEAINQARVEETGLNIPKIREVTVINGKWAIVMDYVEGDTLESLMKKNPEKTQEYLELFIKIQREIHSKKNLLLTKFVDKMVLKIMKSELDASTRYDLSMRLAEMPRHTCVCHGDYVPSNVMIKSDGTYYVLDWSHASQGNGSADAAKTYLTMKMNGQNDLAEMYLTEYSNQVKHDKSYIKKWLPLVAAAQLIKVDENKKKFLMHFIDAEEEV